MDETSLPQAVVKWYSERNRNREWRYSEVKSCSRSRTGLRSSAPWPAGKPWDLIRADVLRALIDNANGDVIRISRFVFVSEYYDCVRNNYADLAKIWEDPRLALSAFGVTLVGLAGDIIQHLGDIPPGVGAPQPGDGAR